MSAEKEEVLEKNGQIDDCLAVVTKGTSMTSADVRSISPVKGGLFNLLLKVDTNQGVFYFKQYLNKRLNDIYSPPKIPASQRSLLALDVQKIAGECSVALGKRIVPPIVCYDKERCAFLMESCEGTPLIEALSQGRVPKEVLTDLPALLGALHQSTWGKFSADSVFGNREFRDFKLGLQYDDLLPQLSGEEGQVVLACKKAYQGRGDCVTHGDINSRNILVGEGSLGVIDFEQSHLGSPAYDLSYILCEVVTSQVHFGGKSYPDLVASFLDKYFEHFSAQAREEVEVEMTTHLAVQGIYRFLGPSKDSWTFYIEPEKKTAIIDWFRALLMKTGPLVKSLRAQAQG